MILSHNTNTGLGKALFFTWFPFLTDSFSEARLKLRRAEDDTDLQSEAEKGRPKKRKTKYVANLLNPV